MPTKKTNKKRSIKDLVKKASRKREISLESKVKKNVMKMIRDDPELYKIVATQGSVSTIVDELLPLGKELIQHPKIVEEMDHNETMVQEFVENPVLTTQLLQVPEVADNIAREPSLIVDILQDASKVKSLTKSLSKSSTHAQPVIISDENLYLLEHILKKKRRRPRKWELVNCLKEVLLGCVRTYFTLYVTRLVLMDNFPKKYKIDFK